MKKIYAFILLSLITQATITNCVAQWSTVYQDNNAQFFDAAFPTDFTGYVAASDTGGAVILRTNDGGITWNKRYIAGWGFINKIVMIDSVKGYIVKGGVPGMLLKTEDGFATYTTYNLDASFVVQALCVLNDSTGFFLNNAARLRKFENNGANFNIVIDTLADGQNLQFFDELTGYMDGGFGLLKTSDGGNTWNYINNNLGFFCSVFNFKDSLNGYFSDGALLYKTSDGGLTFPQQFSFPNAFDFATNGNFCIAANEIGNVAFTLNNGLTWQTETTGINLVANEPYDVVASPNRICYLFSEFCGEIKKRLTITTGIQSASNQQSFNVYPNPFNTFTTIIFKEQQQSTTVTITDISGKKIKSMIYSGTELTFDRNEMTNGIYFLTITDANNHTEIRKLILQ
ncbi:MAG: T9SS type A sorting domain-containing protein [Bacteroidia bacterium]